MCAVCCHVLTCHCSMYVADSGLDASLGRYRVSRSGIYGIFANVVCTSCTAPSTYRITVGINGVFDYINNGMSAVVNGLHGMGVATSHHTLTDAGTTDMINVGGYTALREGDVVELYAYSDTGAAWAVDLNTSWSMLMINEL